jgi:hypothetical protein
MKTLNVSNLSGIISIGEIKGNNIMQTPSIKEMASVKGGCELLRQAILEISKPLLELKKHPEINMSAFENDPLLKLTDEARERESEMKANIMLAYRHLEDARMRIGKVIQAYDGGTSIYDDRPKVRIINIPDTGAIGIIVNGKSLRISLAENEPLTYDGLLSIADTDEKIYREGATVTYSKGRFGKNGTLISGESIEIVEGMIFNVADTSNA